MFEYFFCEKTYSIISTGTLLTVRKYCILCSEKQIKFITELGNQMSSCEGKCFIHLPLTHEILRDPKKVNM